MWFTKLEKGLLKPMGNAQGRTQKLTEVSQKKIKFHLTNEKVMKELLRLSELQALNLNFLCISWNHVSQDK